jgi:hypothetical protein
MGYFSKIKYPNSSVFKEDDLIHVYFNLKYLIRSGDLLQLLRLFMPFYTSHLILQVSKIYLFLIILRGSSLFPRLE